MSSTFWNLEFFLLPVSVKWWFYSFEEVSPVMERVLVFTEYKSFYFWLVGIIFATFLNVIEISIFGLMLVTRVCFFVSLFLLIRSYFLNIVLGCLGMHIVALVQKLYNIKGHQCIVFFNFSGWGRLSRGKCLWTIFIFVRPLWMNGSHSTKAASRSLLSNNYRWRSKDFCLQHSPDNDGRNLLFTIAFCFNQSRWQGPLSHGLTLIHSVDN